MEVLNKEDLVAEVVQKTGHTKKDIRVIVDAYLESITETLAEGGKVKLHGFGNFEVRERAARKGRNPQTSQEIMIPASKAPAFKPAKNLKEAVK